MIIFVGTRSHLYTHKAVATLVPNFRCMSWTRLFWLRRVPRATYIFSDFDRLGFWQLELASAIYRQLEAAGCRVQNDPATVLQRLPLLQRLQRKGLNSFSVWPAHGIDEVDRFPVFIRTVSAHRGNLTELLYNMRELETALDELVKEGYPLSNLMISQYCARPLRDDIYRKMAAYCINGEIVPAPSVHERSWTAKFGELGVAGEEAYREDLLMMQQNPWQADIAKAFEFAKIDYGRADFSVVDGRCEFYEINTNPHFALSETHPFADRITAMKLYRDSFVSAMSTLDSRSQQGSITLNLSGRSVERDLSERLLPGYFWTP